MLRQSHNPLLSTSNNTFQKVREVYGVESIQNNYARKSLESLWKGLCKTVGINSGNIISLDEWVQLLRKVGRFKFNKSNLENLGKQKRKRAKMVRRLPGKSKTNITMVQSIFKAFMFKLFDVSGKQRQTPNFKALYFRRRSFGPSRVRGWHESIRFQVGLLIAKLLLQIFSIQHIKCLDTRNAWQISNKLPSTDKAER